MKLFFFCCFVGQNHPCLGYQGTAASTKGLGQLRDEGEAEERRRNAKGSRRQESDFSDFAVWECLVFEKGLSLWFSSKNIFSDGPPEIRNPKVDNLLSILTVLSF